MWVVRNGPVSVQVVDVELAKKRGAPSGVFLRFFFIYEMMATGRVELPLLPYEGNQVTVPGPVAMWHPQLDLNQRLTQVRSLVLYPG